MRSGPWGAAFVGGSITLFAILIASVEFGFSGHPGYFVIPISVSGVLSFRWWRGVLKIRISRDLPKGHVMKRELKSFRMASLTISP